ncbi:MAG: peptidylprolyl isomerase [Saprospiraceae bacterium]|nr:peptidylprolyl isomerase [Saprospiraceae bacterium]
MNRVFPVLIAMLFFTTGLLAQNADPVLFSVNGVPVHVSEFDYIYSKTNQKKADYSKASLEDYLDLYIKFKLKVQRAKEMKLDTIPSLINELEGYRRQLADSYLIDREVTDKLVKEAYERSKTDVDISHIMVSLPLNPSPADTSLAYKKIKSARDRLKKGEDFGQVAVDISTDKGVDKHKGHIGYINVLFPNGFYALENAAYSLKAGQVSDILRTPSGYHLVKLNGTRPARGEMEVAHILLRAKSEDEMAAKKSTIDSLYKLLEAGSAFEELAKTYSDDSQSAKKGGYIGFFGINRYEEQFEEAAFALENDGQLSKPFQTSLGWHIVKRISKKDIPAFNIAKSGWQTKIKQDARFEIAKDAMIQRIKAENNFREDRDALEAFVTTLDSSFFDFRWKPGNIRSAAKLFAIGNEMNTTVSHFEEYLSKSTRDRIAMRDVYSAEEAARMLYDKYVNENCLAYEERHLEEKYPDFKALMREYEEGILLFEATKIEVWDKASQDSVGLAEFFKTVDGNYMWDRRAVISIYRVDASLKDQIEDIRTFSKTNRPDQVLAKYNANNEGDKPLVTAVQQTIERGKKPILDQMLWEVGSLSPIESSMRDKSLTFFKIEDILEIGPKSLEEARGYVVADYQDFLEKEWVKELQGKYEVEVNQEVFNGLVQ